MSSTGSLSPPRKTVISNVPRGTDDAGNLQVDDLLKLRNRKLMEMYCVSRLSQLLEIHNESELKADIEDFLRLNDIRRGNRFELATLPKLRQLEPTVTEPPEVNSRKKDQQAKKSLANMQSEVVSLYPQRQQQQQHLHSQMLQKAQRAVSEAKRRPDEDEPDTAEQRSGKRIKLHEHSEDNHTDSQKHSAMLPPSMSISTVSPVSHHHPQSLPRPVYYMNLNMPPAEPTPVELSEKFSSYLLKEVTKKAIESNDYFKENNINSKESVYLLMKDIIPSKIAQALPLAELKYMVQTLPLIKLIPMAHKALTTDIMNNALSEGRITVVSSRIEELRRLGLWSLRQPKKFIDAWTNEQSHHRTLIEEGKWMQADFKEGQKYKVAICTTLAHAIMEYWAYGKVCCVKIASKDEENDCVLEYSPTVKDVTLDTDRGKNEDIDEEGNDCTTDSNSKERTPEPVEIEYEGIDTRLLSEKVESSCTTPKLSVHSPNFNKEKIMNGKKDPFKLVISFDELNSTERTIARDIPLYTGLQKMPDLTKNLPFAPISKTMITLQDDHFFKLVERQIVDDEQSLVQLSKRRGMFYGNRRSHYLKPPPAPSLRYLENRTPTIWLPEDDQELVKNINAYAYNWELISAHMTRRSSSSYLSNIERRTPWQCFERFVQLNEKFNFNDLKGPRAHSVQQWLMEAHKFQQKQNRRISPLGVGQESIQRGHRRLRWASMFEAMRKCIKKRENAPRPNPTQPRKPLDCKNMTVPTPAEMSKLKAQRDEALRRDIQMRRSVKNRLQQQSSQISSSHTPSRTASRDVNIKETATNSTSAVAESESKAKTPSKNIPAPVSSQRQFTEREIIEGYTKKILAQKPELSLENAMKAAQNYYRQAQQQKLQSQQQRKQQFSSNSLSVDALPQQQSPPQSHASGQKKEVDGKVRSAGINSNLKSPTPQEILERFQKS